MPYFDRVLSLDMTQGPTLDPHSLYQSPGQEMLGPCRRWMPDVYSISSERLIRLVFGEGHAAGQHVWTPAAPDMPSPLYTHLMSLPNPTTPPGATCKKKPGGSSCQVAVNRSHLHKTKHMAMCNVKWDALVPIRDLWLMRVKDYCALVVENKPTTRAQVWLSSCPVCLEFDTKKNKTKKQKNKIRVFYRLIWFVLQFLSHWLS